MNEPTRRQLTALGFVALLSPATRLLPGAAARLGGHAGWLGSVLAAPLCVLAALLVSRAVKNRRPGEGLGQLLLRALPRLSRPVLLIYGLWLAFYAGFAVRSAASRFIYTIYTGSSPWPFAAVGLAAGTLAALGSVRQLARAAEIFRALLMLTLAPILALGLAQLDWGYRFGAGPLRPGAGRRDDLSLFRPRAQHKPFRRLAAHRGACDGPLGIV